MAQRRKTVFLEVLGNGLIASGNFDLRLKPAQNDGLGLRAGVGGAVFPAMMTREIQHPLAL